jgi:hypothetical protein
VRKIFGLTGAEVRGYWRKLPSKELHNLSPLQNVIQLIILRRMRWARHVAYMREKRNAHIFSFGKPKGTRLLGRHGHRSEININTDLRAYNTGHGLG